MYFLFGVYGVYIWIVIFKLWFWFVFEMLFRFIEFVMGFMLFYCVFYLYVGWRKCSFIKILCFKRKGKIVILCIVIILINGWRDGDFF